MFSRYSVLIFMGYALMMLAGCGDNSSRSADPDPVAPTAQEFVERLVADWNGVDYSFNLPDGTTDSDSDGEVDSNDAVNFVRTFQALGYMVPATSVSGLHDNYYTEEGFADVGDSSVAKIDFAYTVAGSVTEEDLKAMDWSGLSVGDLLFVDFNKDFRWDIAAVYLGAYGELAHAAFFSSDYEDISLVVDLDDPTMILNLDIQFGYSAVRIPNYEGFAAGE